MTPDKVEAAMGVVRGLRDEMKGLPHSLGYEYTHMAKVDEALATLTSALAESERDAVRYRTIRCAAKTLHIYVYDDANDPYSGDWHYNPSPNQVDAFVDAMKDTDHAR